VAGERAARVWSWIAAARQGDVPVSLAALCRAAAARLAVDGASVTAAGGLAVSGLAVSEPLTATDELSVQLEELLLTTGEGPGAEDFMFGSPMLIPDLARLTERWPGFAPAAVAAGARAVFAFPLQAGAIQTLTGRCVGLLEVDAAGLLLADTRGALRLIAASTEQAKGVLAERLRVTPDEAFVTLRRYARDHNHPLTELAGDVIRGTARIAGDG
jgi:hypothetical protein